MNESEMLTFVGEHLKYAKISIESTQLVNKSFEFGFMLYTIPICLVTIVLNMAVMRILWKEEKTLVNQLMMLDSIANMSFSSLGTFQQSPYFRGLGLQVFCYPHLVFTFASIIFNRLLPVSIVIFR